MSNELKKKGYETNILVINPYGELYHDFINASDRVFIIPRGMETLKYYIKKLTSVIKNIQPDIIINNAVPYIQVIYSVLDRNIKKYSVLHSEVIREVKICLSNSNFVNKIICVSDNCQKTLLSLNNQVAAKTIVIPVGIKTEARDQLDWGKELQIIYVGRICKELKNIKAIIKILLGLRERNIHFKMHFVGSGNYLDTLSKLVREKELEQECVFYGSVSPNEVHDYLIQANIFILTSYSEGTPHALLEAMAVGVIPVSSRISGSTDKIIINRVNGLLCEVNNTNQYLDAIDLLLINKTLRKSIQENSIQYVKKNYSIDEIVKRYKELFNHEGININSSSDFVFDEFSKLLCPSFLRNVRSYIGNYKRRIFDGIRPISYK